MAVCMMIAGFLCVGVVGVCMLLHLIRKEKPELYDEIAHFLEEE